MNYKLINKILILIGFLTLTTTIFAQFEKKAQVGMKFLSNPVSAEVIGKGTAGINSTLNSNGIFWNPALTSLIPTDIDVSLNYHQWIADISYNAVAASFKVLDYGVVTVSGNMMDYGDLYTTVRSDNEQGYIETGTFKPTAYVVGLGFAQKVSDRFSYGINLKFVKQNLGDAWVTASGDSMHAANFALKKQNYSTGIPAVDFGTYYDFKYKGITFAATVTNISREIKYEEEDFPLPFAVSFGGTVAPLMFLMDDVKDHGLVVNVESYHPRDFGERLKIGLEYSYQNTFFVRSGYVTNQDERDFSAGVGFRKTFANTLFRIDYAFQPFGIFGNLHYFTVGIGY
jgi:hypothetical protein